MEGDCYQLVAKYLQTKNKAYIISDGIRGKYCTWNFKGDTDKDFASWCKREGLVCVGNPLYVGYDSVWYNGDFIPHQRAIFLKSQEDKINRERHVLDSLSSLPRDTLPTKKITIEYLEVGKQTAERLGFRYSEYIATAEFWNYNDLFSVSIQAQDMGDTTFIYRTYTSVYDSTISVFWGGSRDRLTQSNVTANGVVSNNYVSENYGLQFDVNNMTYSYEHSTDYEHRISGTGKLVKGTNNIFGTYQYNYEELNYLPVLGKLPFIGFLFRHVQHSTEVRYIFIVVRIFEGVDNVDAAM